MFGVITTSHANVQPQTLPLPVMMVIDGQPSWRRSRDFPEDTEGLHWARYHDLQVDLLEEINPDVILSPLFAPYFDAMDLASRLESLGFVGRYRVIATTIPNPAMIRREIAAAAPRIDFDIFTIDEDGVNILPQMRGKAPRR